MPRKKSSQTLTSDTMQNLLAEQSKIILGAVDEKFAKVDERFAEQDKRMIAMEIRIVADVDRKLVAMEMRINQKIDRLTTTLDKFLKRLTDLEDEFEIMKEDLKRVKAILKQKLGVDLS